MHTLTSNTLAHALHEAKAQHYREALAAIRAAKEADPKNVYILAIEKQLTKLVEFTDPSSNSDEEANETYELLQILVNRALGGKNVHSVSHNPAPSEKVQSTHHAAPKMDRESSVAILKKQYLSRADACMLKGDHQGALCEVRRIFVLDPGDQTAHDYEQRIEDLLSPRTHVPPIVTVPELPKEPLVVKVPLVFGEDTPPFAGTEIRTLTETPPDDHLHTPATLEDTVTRPSRWKNVLTGVMVFALFAASAYYIWWQQSAEEKLMARTVANQSSSAVTPEEEKDQAVGLETSSKSAGTPAVSKPPTTTPLPVSIPKPIDKKVSTALTTKSDELASPSNAKRLQTSPADVKSTEPESAITQAESVKAKTPTSVPSQSLTSLEVKPLTSLSRQPDIQQPGQQFIPVQKEPRLVRLEKIQFPQNLLRDGIEGEVIVKVRISAEGKPLEGKVLKSSNPLFDEPVLQAAMNSDYSPGMMTSGPVTTWATIPFKFKR